MNGRVGFTLTEADLVSALDDWRRSRRRPWRDVALASIVGIGVFAWQLRHGEEVSTAAVISVVAIVGGLLAGSLTALLVARLYLRRYATLTFRQQRALQGDVAVEWDEHGLTATGLTGTTHLAWDQWHGWADGRSALLLFQSDYLYNIVPHRALPDTDREAIVAHLCAAGVPGRRSRPYSTQSRPIPR